MNNVIDDIFKEIIKILYNVSTNKKTKKRLEIILKEFKLLILNEIGPYLYTIMAILILMLIINFFQFYYYLKATL